MEQSKGAIALKKGVIYSAEVMADGRISMPKHIMEMLGVTVGDSVCFIVEGNTVRLVNSAVYAMQMLQTQMQGEAKCAGLEREDDVVFVVKDLRDGDA